MKGYVYALINPSLPGLVKVGRTDRDPISRALELSAHTGVPTPFIVAYQRFVSDCEHGEAWVHTVLERGGGRLSAQREFFTIPLHEVVEAIHSYPDPAAPSSEATPRSPGAGEAEDESLDGLVDGETPPWLQAFVEAEAYDYGLGDVLEDAAEAFRLYQQAARLGSILAFRRLGNMSAAGRGTARSTEEALAYFKKAVQLGDYVSYGNMAMLYFEQGHEANEQKCWTCFLDRLALYLEGGGDLEVEAEHHVLSHLRRALGQVQREAMHPSWVSQAKVYGEELLSTLAPRILDLAINVRGQLYDRGLPLSDIDAATEWLNFKCGVPPLPVAHGPAWKLKGMCQVCGMWLYLDDLESPSHCGRPLIEVTRR